MSRRGAGESTADDVSRLVIADGWMFAGVSGSLLVVGRTDEITVEFERTTDVGRLIDVLSTGATVQTVSDACGLTVTEAERFITGLRELGALVPWTVPGDLAGLTPLHQALGAEVARPTGRAELICTADELLILPVDLDDGLRTIALRNFVAGLEPWGRLRAYASLISGEGHIGGDRPSDISIAAASDLDDSTDPMVVRLHTGEASRTSRAELVRGGFDRAHRLGLLTQESAPQSLGDQGLPDIWYTIASVAESNFADPTPPMDRRVQGSGDRDHSRLSARAEGAERYALRTVDPERIRWASEADLGAVIRPEDVIAFNERQLESAYPVDPVELVDLVEPRPWCETRSSSGETRWIDATLVYFQQNEWPPLAGSALRRTSSSGVAAHTSLDHARESALAELVERDAFMWTWVQQISRERIDPDSVPAHAVRWARALERHGWITHWVNLTLEAWPVVLCCLVRPQGGLVIGAACKATPDAALVRATHEALVLALRFDQTENPPTTPESVRRPLDHLRLHAHQPSDAARFLYSAEKMVSLGSLPSDLSLERQLAGSGVDVFYADLTSGQTAPFHVVRAFAPGLVPLTFGWDREPLGMPILERRRQSWDGELVGSELDLARKQMSWPHPFA